MEKVMLIDGQRPDVTGGAGTLDFRLAAQERLSLVLLVLPAGEEEVTLPIRVMMDGEGADFQLHALCLCGKKEKVSVKVHLEHLVPGASSRQLIRCVAGGESRVAFDGLIKVLPGAQRTEAFQTSNSLLLSERAKVSTQPQLEIYADDVKCSHGATTGTLDEDEQYYMRSRGITLEQARLLQLRSFVWPVLAAVSDGQLRVRLDDRVRQALSRL